MLGVHFAAVNRDAVDALYDARQGGGRQRHGRAGRAAAQRRRRLRLPVQDAGRPRAQHLRRRGAPSERQQRPLEPSKLSHVVLNSAKIDQQTSFFIDVLGFKLSDQTDMMDFVRCSRDHHSIAMARGNGPTLNHMAYEVASIDGLMRGAGRHEEARLQRRVGRRPPRPRRQRVHLFRRAERLRGRIHRRGPAGGRGDLQGARRRILAQFPDASLPLGHGRHPSNRLKAAVGGDISVADPEAGKRCEEIMAQTLGR